MKTVIAALNSKYIHMSLAPWYLKAAAEDVCDITVLELTINQDRQALLRRIYVENPDVLAFSCYIFNITKILALVNDIHEIFPNILILLGGPEVSYNAVELLERHSAVDCIICGEGETRFRRLLAAATADEPFTGIDGVAFRSGGEIRYTPPQPASLPELDGLPSPYTDEMLAAAAGKIAYFEASRGCPFSCGYCLSAQSGGVRRFCADRIKSDLTRLMHSGARQIKFVDRTFNANPARAAEIVTFILDTVSRNPGSTPGSMPGEKNYHFEAAADLFDDPLIRLLAGAPAGLFQLEIGIQSFNEQALAAAARKTDLARCEENIQKLLAPGNMHIHLDLIAGLPYEDYASFSESFNRVFALRPHCIQLGFLKLLRGSALRAQAERYGYRYSPLPPYEVLSTPWLSYGDLLRLGDVETAVDAVYNSGRFPRTLLYLTARFDTPFAFFYRFSQSLREAYPDGIGIPSRALCELLLAFTREQLGEAAAETVNELLKYDFFATDSSRTPPKALCRHELPGARALYDADRAAGPRVQYERFAVDPLRPENGRQTVDLRFDYTQKDPVTGRYAVTKL